MTRGPPTGRHALLICATPSPRTDAREMSRRLLNLLTALSLLPCVAACGLWVRSYLVPESVDWWRNRMDGSQWRNDRFHLVSSCGGIGFVRDFRRLTLSDPIPPSARSDQWYWQRLRLDPDETNAARFYAGGVVDSGRRLLGFGFSSIASPPYLNRPTDVDRSWSVGGRRAAVRGGARGTRGVACAPGAAAPPATPRVPVPPVWL